MKEVQGTGAALLPGRLTSIAGPGKGNPCTLPPTQVDAFLPNLRLVPRRQHLQICPHCTCRQCSRVPSNKEAHVLGAQSTATAPFLERYAYVSMTVTHAVHTGQVSRCL